MENERFWARAMDQIESIAISSGRAASVVLRLIDVHEAVLAIKVPPPRHLLKGEQAVQLGFRLKDCHRRKILSGRFDSFSLWSSFVDS